MFKKIKLLLALNRAKGDIAKAGSMKEKFGSRKWWITLAVAVIGVGANALGVTPEHWQPIADWLQNILYGYLASQGTVDAAKAIAAGMAAKKEGTQ